MDSDRPSSSAFHRAPSGVRRSRPTSAVPESRVTRQAQRFTKSVIRPIGVDRANVPNTGDDLPEVEVPSQSIPRRVLPGIQMAIPDLLGADLSRHPSAHLHANEVC